MTNERAEFVRRGYVGLRDVYGGSQTHHSAPMPIRVYNVTDHVLFVIQQAANGRTTSPINSSNVTTVLPHRQLS